ncbi:hypothetical protein ACFYV5_10695 [Streptomyces sp. NPDC003035]|uniref:hypothetical protein n=1 Tax=Streptomyces sp. NPDC003035 TaxID=3364676 RepID=UPI0036A7030D
MAVGADDTLLPPSRPRRAAARLGTDLRVLDNAGHVALDEAADGVAALAADALARVAAGRGGGGPSRAPGV